MILFDDPKSSSEIAYSAACTYSPDVNTSITRVSNGRTMGGVIYENYNGHSIGAHIAGLVPNWLSQDLLLLMFHYPFVQLGCRKIFGTVPSYNARALAFDYKLGFKYVTRVPEVFENGDMIIISMDRQDCRWLSLRPRTLEYDHG